MASEASGSAAAAALADARRFAAAADIDALWAVIHSASGATLELPKQTPAVKQQLAQQGYTRLLSAAVANALRLCQATAKNGQHTLVVGILAMVLCTWLDTACSEDAPLQLRMEVLTDGGWSCGVCRILSYRDRDTCRQFQH